MSSAGCPSDYFKDAFCSLSYGHGAVSRRYEHESTHPCYTHTRRLRYKAGIKEIDAHAEDPSS